MFLLCAFTDCKDLESIDAYAEAQFMSPGSQSSAIASFLVSGLFSGFENSRSDYWAGGFRTPMSLTRRNSMGPSTRMAFRCNPRITSEYTPFIISAPFRPPPS